MIPFTLILMLLGITMFFTGLIFSFKTKEPVSAPVTEQAPVQNEWKTSSWTEQDFRHEFDSVFADINSKEFGVNKFLVRLKIDTVNKTLVIEEWYGSFIFCKFGASKDTYEWKDNYRAWLHSIKNNIVWELVRAQESILQWLLESEDKKFTEQIKKLNQ